MRLNSLRALVLSASLAGASLSAVPAFAEPTADDIATARSLGQEGQAALEKKDYKTAEERFGRAWKLYPGALTLGLGYARAALGNNPFVAAQEAYNRVAHTPKEGLSAAFKQAVDAANNEGGAVAPHRGGVTITVAAAGGGELPGLKVTLDDQPINTAGLGVKRPVDPGQHTV